MSPQLKTFLFNIGVTSSGFPFEFGRNPYKGKRPLRDIIGSYKNRHSSGDPLIEGTPSGGGSLAKPVCEMQLQIQSQQEELEQLKKDLSSQKVTLSFVSPHLTSPGAFPDTCCCGPHPVP